MKTVKGIYAKAKIFTDDVEAYAEAQVKMICDNEVAEGSTICMMPDVHPGKVGPIGLSMTVTDKVIPQLLGVDIGCGMTCVKLNKSNAEFQKLDRVIRENIPSGISTGKRQRGAWARLAAATTSLSLTEDRMAACIWWCIQEAGIWARKWRNITRSLQVIL